MNTYLTPAQAAVLKMARELGCEIYCDAPRKQFNERRRTRIKGVAAWDQKLYVAACEAFGFKNVQPYKAKRMITGDEFNALSIVRD